MKTATAMSRHRITGRRISGEMMLTAPVPRSDPTKALIAIRRGAAMNVDLNNGWDYWPVMGEQIEELRRRYNILPAEAFYPTNVANTLEKQRL